MPSSAPAAEALGGPDGVRAYNLGIALLQDGHAVEAIEQLDKAGEIKASDHADWRSATVEPVLGTILYESADFGRAEQSLDRVRLDGPFSNQAAAPGRLGRGLGGALTDRALFHGTSWCGANRRTRRSRKQCSPCPRLCQVERARPRRAHVRQRARVVHRQIERVDASINSIREGEFLKALVREEIRQDKDWVITPPQPAGRAETYYLMELMASHDFQTALQNYLDLEDLRSKLVTWESSFDAFEDIIRLRGQNYEPLLPEVDAQFRELDSQMRLRLEQRKHINERLQAMLTAPRPDYLATADERILGERIAEIDRQLDGSDSPEAAALRQRAAHVTGRLTWRCRRIPRAADRAHVHLHELNAHVDALNAQYEAFVRTRQPRRTATSATTSRSHACASASTAHCRGSASSWPGRDT